MSSRPLPLIFSLLLVSQLKAWRILTFDVDLIPRPSKMYVSERIRVDFEGELRHGIYRTIPLRVKMGGLLRLENIRVINVEVDGEKTPFKVTRTPARVKIKIGDPSRYVSGVHTYTIDYSISGVYRFHSEYDEIYWNVTGNEWETTIEKASCTIHLNDSLRPLEYACYTGRYGSTQSECNSEVTDGYVVFRTSDILKPLEGFTVAVAFEKGYFEESSKIDEFTQLLYTLWPLLLPVFTLAFMYRLWKTRGKDPEFAVAVKYTPPPLSAGECGVIYDENVDPRDIVATILELANSGYLEIYEEESSILFFKKKDYLFARKEGKNPLELKEHQRLLYFEIFSTGKDRVKLSELKRRGPRILKLFRRKLYSRLVNDGYFPSPPDKVRVLYFISGFLLILLGMGIFFHSFIEFRPYFLLGPSLFFSGLIVKGFAPFMPKKTRKGARIYVHLKGFREFFERVEKDRIERMREENPSIFYEYLPYAVALGVDDMWVLLLDEMGIEAPHWMHSRTGHFSMLNLSNMLNDFSKGFSPRTSGGGHGVSGGFSGGGSGGGGGGAW